MAKFIGQLFSWIATDIIVKGLANNRTFQRVVLKVDKFQTTAEALAEEKAAEVMKMAQEGKDAALKMKIAAEQTEAAAKVSQDKMKDHAKAAGIAAGNIHSTTKDAINDIEMDIHEKLTYLRNQLEIAQTKGDFELAAKLQNMEIPLLEKEIREMNSKGIHIV